MDVSTLTIIFGHFLMNQRPTIHSLRKVLSAIFLVLLLGWLTISLPFVYNAQQHAMETAQSNGEDGPTSNKNLNPLSNTTEEKTPDQVQEYLHGQPENLEFETSDLDHLHAHACKVYIAFHGELLSPPPNI